ncbi:MAG TPA: caspase family protein [Hyphomicrobiaceae bacterium]|nr:caspase family protein [Hyphomicrobiaceae bacterium]
MGARFFWRAAIYLLAPLALVTAIAASAEAATRRAFIVGNSAYQFTSVLPNPVSDAQDMAARLRDLGWDVTVQLDVSRAEMLKAFASFTQQLQSDDMSLVYFAGHALQMGGENYLAPVDARIESEEGVKRQFVPLNALLADLSRLSRTRIVILDACRDNPFAEGIAAGGKTRSLGAVKGLARVYAGVGSFIVYSTQPGNVALDGSGRNSPFTRALLEYMPLAGADVHAVMRRVRAAVQQETNEAQIPWENSSLVDEVAFAGTGAPPPRQMADAPPMPAPRSDPRGMPMAPPVMEKFHYVTGLDPKGDNFLALRTGPTPADVRIATMGPDTLLRVRESRGPWRRVELIDGMTGWAHSNWIACCRTMAVPRAQPAAVPVPPPRVPAASPSAADSCDDLWFRRNAIWHSYGYCFTTARARQVFDTSSCFRDQRAAQAAMSPASRAEVDSLQAREKALGCR